jgi:hypothetical protein
MFKKRKISKIFFKLLNPTLSITPSKPFVSSGLLFTRVNCMIYYLTHVNYNPAAADLTSIGVTIAPTVEGGGGGGPVRGGRRAGTGREAGRYGEGGGQVWGGRSVGTYIWEVGTDKKVMKLSVMHYPHVMFLLLLQR